MMPRLPWILAAFLAFGPALAAQQPVKGKRHERTVLALELLRTKIKEAERRGSNLQQKLVALGPDEKEQRQELRDQMTNLRQLVQGARMAFVNEFDQSDWEVWELPNDMQLLEEGLAGVGMRYLNRDPGRAVRAFEMLVDKLPECRSALRIQQYLLPAAAVQTADSALAIKKLYPLVEEADEQWKPVLQIFLADAYAMDGALISAQEVCQAVLKSVPRDLEDENDPRQGVRAQADLRIKLLGNAPYDFMSANWFGWQPQPLSEILQEGRVVALNFFGTWSPQSRPTLIELDNLYAEYGDQGFLPIGITRYFTNAFVPELREAINAGETLSEINRGEFVRSLVSFRQNTRMMFPWTIVNEALMEQYGAEELPLTILIGRDGKVAHIVEGSGKDYLIRKLVEQMVAEPVVVEASGAKSESSAE